MIVVFNALTWGFEHVPFDAALIAAVEQAFPGEPIHFWAEAEHLRQTRAQLQRRDHAKAVVWRELVIPPRHAPLGRRLRDDVVLARRLLSEAQRLGATRMICCCMHPRSGLAALKLLAALYRLPAVAFIHHAGLLSLLSSRRYHPLLTVANGRVKQVVLGSSIRAEVVRQLPALGAHLASIRHPYLFDPATPSELPGAGAPSFAFLGMVAENKGFADFARLAEEFAGGAGEGPAQVRFDLIGGVPADATAAIPPSVRSHAAAGPLTRETYERLLREASYTIFPYDPGFYSLVASGAVLDTLAAGKPLIALRNSQFEEMFAAMGDIGYLCADLAEMRAVVGGILKDPPRARYRRQSENILARRSIYGPAAVGDELRRLFSPAS
ncbi:MAG TPA: hypothetical protein VHO67_12395 [Polyangia bacterium]|nr:hypothetical protein [Polyangia bacterium]